jgi:hypothetical protein
MAKWTTELWNNDDGITLLRDGKVAAGVESADVASEIARKLNAFDEMLAALKSVLPFVEDEQECRERSFLPEPDAQDEVYLTNASQAVETIRAAIKNAEDHHG